MGVDGPLQVARAGSGGTPTPAEEIAENSEATLRPGDSAAYRFEFPAVYANRAATPVHLVSGGLLGGYAPAPIDDYVVTEFTEIFPVPPLPAGAVTMDLVRVTLAPGESLPSPPAGAQEAFPAPRRCFQSQAAEAPPETRHRRPSSQTRPHRRRRHTRNNKRCFPDTR